MATIMDAFTREDRVELTVSQLIALIDDRARAEAENVIMKKAAQMNLYSYQIAELFPLETPNNSKEGVN